MAVNQFMRIRAFGDFSSQFVNWGRCSLGLPSSAFLFNFVIVTVMEETRRCSYVGFGLFMCIEVSTGVFEFEKSSACWRDIRLLTKELVYTATVKSIR